MDLKKPSSYSSSPCCKCFSPFSCDFLWCFCSKGEFKAAVISAFTTSLSLSGSIAQLNNNNWRKLNGATSLGTLSPQPAWENGWKLLQELSGFSLFLIEWYAFISDVSNTIERERRIRTWVAVMRGAGWSETSDLTWMKFEILPQRTVTSPKPVWREGLWAGSMVGAVHSSHFLINKVFRVPVSLVLSPHCW